MTSYAIERGYFFLKMSKNEVSEPKREVSINIKKADNGFVVNVYGKKEDKTYVYENFEDAIKELKAVFSVAEQEEE